MIFLAVGTPAEAESQEASVPLPYKRANDTAVPISVLFTFCAADTQVLDPDVAERQITDILKGYKNGVTMKGDGTDTYVKGNFD